MVQIVVMREKLLHAVFPEEGDAAFTHGEINLFRCSRFDDCHDIRMRIVFHICPDAGDVFFDRQGLFFLYQDKL